MHKPGHLAMMVGLAWFALGAIAAIILFFAVTGAAYIYAASLMLVGIIPFAIGLWQNLAERFMSPKDRARRHAELELRALVRAMVAMAAADGHLDPVEARAIANIYRELIGHPPPAGLIEKIAATMHDGEYSLHDDLGLIEGEISIPMREKIIQACYLVIAADGVIAEAEKARINELAATMHIAPDEAARLVEAQRAKMAQRPAPTR